MQHKNTIMPEIGSLDPLPGVSISVKGSVKLHFQRLTQQLGKYTMTVKEGLDGSGTHIVYMTKRGMCKHITWSYGCGWLWMFIEMSQ